MSSHSSDNVGPSTVVSADHPGETKISEQERQGAMAGRHGPPPFKWASLWQPPVINPINGKSYTLPLLHFGNKYTINFWLATLSFFVAFFSWFAWPPLNGTIRTDLKLTQAQIINSNIVGLAATLGTRFAVGPLIDRYGPRYVMAGILLAGLIPSGLAGTAHNAGSLYTVKFFIGILGGTFVPCVAWTTSFFDKSIVGKANALSAGWGNAGGGAVFLAQTGIFERLRSDGVTPHVAWRVCFVILPVPLLLMMIILNLAVGTDHPAGKWSQRHTLPATAIAVMHGEKPHLDHSEELAQQRKANEKEGGSATVAPAPDREELDKLESEYKSQVDTAVNEALTFPMFLEILGNPRTWLAALSYMTSFGGELALDAQLPATFVSLFSMSQVRAGEFVSMYGLLNVITRPIGGLAADAVYKRYGVPGKKWLTLVLAGLGGIFMIGLGVYIEHKGKEASLTAVMILIVIIAFTTEGANGSNFAMVPHLNPRSNGFMSGIVGSCGNLGGIWWTLVFRFEPLPLGKAYWIIGIVITVVNLILAPVPVPKW